MNPALTFDVPLYTIGCGPNDRVHWSTRARRAKNLREIGYLRAHSVMRENPMALPESSKTPARLRYTVTWAKGKRRLNDPDNLIAQLKPFTDGLRDAGLIHDDSPQWLTLLPVEQRKGTAPMLSVQIEIEWAEGKL